MNFNLRQSGMWLGLATLLCLSPAWADDVTVTVHLNSKGCPVFVTSDQSDLVNTVTAKRGQDRIGWKLSESSKKFRIYFSPFSPPLKGQNGEIKPRPIPQAHAAVEYKYSVEVEGCENYPLDPRIIVKN